MEKLKRVVIKEELVALTGNYVDAILLQQFIYWSERTRDVDRYIKEEKERCQRYGEDAVIIEKSHGWIYKSAEELSSETMIGLSPSSIRRHIKDLINKGWLNNRNNPKFKWDRTIQYRVDMIKIQNDLLTIGYALEGYKVDISAISKIENGSSEIENQSEQNRKAIPEITTDTTPQIEKEKDKGIFPNGKDSAHFSKPSDEVITIRDYFEQVYYFKYKVRYHRHKAEQNIYIDNRLKEIIDEYDEDTTKAFIDNYFEYKFDHNLIHFIEEGIIQNRFYEVAL